MPLRLHEFTFIFMFVGAKKYYTHDNGSVVHTYKRHDDDRLIKMNGDNNRVTSDRKLSKLEL